MTLLIDGAWIESMVVSLGTVQGLSGELSRAATGGLVAAVWQGVLLVLLVAMGLKLLPKTPRRSDLQYGLACF